MLAGLACSDLAPHIAGMLQEQARQLGIPFATVARATIASDLEDWLIASRADAALVQTFPYRIPAAVLDLPRHGFFNIHPGKLPAFRGPDPVFWQIKQGSASGAATLHRMTPAFDDGPIVWMEEVAIGPEDTYGVHLSVLIEAAGRCIEQFIALLSAGELPALPAQSEAEAGYQGRPGLDDLTVDWSASDAAAIAALARAANPTYQGAVAFLRDTPVRILEARPTPFEPIPRLPAGTVIATTPDRGLLVLCAGGTVLQLAIVATDEGTFSGARFAALFGISIGEKFSMPAFVS
ncbi:MAG: formyltransferase family protein [Rhodothermales bacterium]